MPIRLLCLLLLGLTLALPAPFARAQADGADARGGGAEEDVADWSGRWRTYWREGQAIVTMWQDGATVRGSYEPGGGRIQGEIEGALLTGIWQQTGASGAFVFARSPEGDSFVGRFGGGEYWNGSRIDGAQIAPTPFFGSGTPRETLRAVAAAANAAERGESGAGLVYDRLFAYAGGAPPDARDEARRRQLLVELISLATFRLSDVPSVGTGGEARFELGPAGVSWTFELDFAQSLLGTWQIVVPPRALLEAHLADLLAAADAPSLDAYLEVRADNPRRALRAFLDGTADWEAGGAQDALATLDLTGIPETLQPTEGPLAADYLQQIIARIGYVIDQEIPDDPGRRQPYVHFEHELGEIEIARDEQPGAGNGPAWRFSAETLAVLPQIYEVMQALPLAEGQAPPAALTSYFQARTAVQDVSPALLDRVVLLETWQWLALGLALLVTVLVARVGIWALRGGIVSTLALLGAAGDVRAAVHGALGWPARMVAVGLILGAVIRELGLRQDIAGLLAGLAAVVMIVGAIVVAYRLVDAAGIFLNRQTSQTKTRVDDMAVAVGTGVAKIAVILLGILAGAQILGLPYEGVIAGLGVGGLALAIAARESVANMLGAAILMADRPFKRGDLIEAGGYLGMVEEVGLRSTRIRTLDDALMVVPNGKLADDTVNNWGRLRDRRVQLAVQLSNETPRDRLDAFVQRTRTRFAAQPESTRAPFVGLKGFGEGSVDVELMGWLRTPDYRDFVAARHRLVGDIVDTAQELGIAFAAPPEDSGEGGPDIAPRQGLGIAFTPPSGPGTTAAE